MRRLLIIDGEGGTATWLRGVLADTGFEISWVKLVDVDGAVKQADVIFFNASSSHLSILDALRTLRQEAPKTPIIVLSERVSTSWAIEAMREGAYDYITPSQSSCQIRELLNKAIHSQQRKVALASPSPHGDEVLIGESSEMVEIYKLIGQIARSDASVLIQGESGTGKELVARAIHHNSFRKDERFLAVNCAAIPETLLESELFGYERGAFTGALERRLGKFEQCNGGTVFLDEIADMPLSTQSKILRVLEGQEFERLGGDRTIKVDVRIIAATNKSLVKCTKEESFRVDLFYRLKITSLYLPPLRDRGNDIILLANHFLRRYANELNKEVQGASDKALEVLRQYPWPGNVRELENNIQAAVILCKGNVLFPEHFPIFQDQERIGSPEFKMADNYCQILMDAIAPVFDELQYTGRGRVYDEIIAALEKALISLTMKRVRSNQVQAAKLLGISRNTLRDRIKKHGLY